jgi:hypothetical protein
MVKLKYIAFGHLFRSKEPANGGVNFIYFTGKITQYTPRFEALISLPYPYHDPTIPIP